MFVNNLIKIISYLVCLSADFSMPYNVMLVMSHANKTTNLLID